MDEESGARHLTFGSSYKTSDFIVDVLEAKWAALDAQDGSVLDVEMDCD